MPSQRFSNLAWLGVVLLLAAGHVLLLIQPAPSWPDSELFTGFLNHGKWVGHPPGYPLFFALCHLLMGLGLQAVYAQQIVSSAAYLVSIPLLFALLQRFTESRRALLLTAAFAFSWIPFNIAASGTSHSSDLLFSCFFLWIATSPGFKSGQLGSYGLFFISLLLCGANRFSLIIMAGPFLLLLSLYHFRRPAWWIGCLLYTAGQVGLFFLIVRLYGGAGLYQEKVAALREVNAAASPILSGLHPATVLNFLRTFFWLFIATPLLCLLFIRHLPRLYSKYKRLSAWPYEVQTGLALLSGCLGLCALYVCVHPGYLAAALPPLFLLAAVAFDSKTVAMRTLASVLGASVLLALGMFHGMQSIQHPGNVREAAANALLLQYSDQGLRNPGWKSLSRWLLDEGLKEDVPEARRDATK